MARTLRTSQTPSTRKPKAQPVTVTWLGLNHLSETARQEAVRRSGGDGTRVEVIDGNPFIVRWNAPRRAVG